MHQPAFLLIAALVAALLAFVFPSAWRASRDPAWVKTVQLAACLSVVAGLVSRGLGAAGHVSAWTAAIGDATLALLVLVLAGMLSGRSRAGGGGHGGGAQ